jgi:hypothetical protein
MSSRLDLGPADLDRLEDALEELELEAGLAALVDDDPVAQRLSEYRELLLLAREAMPLEDVPAGLLDGVLAEARQAANAAPAAATPAPSFWARWRLGVWVPTLAFAGSAALLLLVLVPERSRDGDTAELARAEPGSRAQAKADAKAADAADGRLAFAESSREQAEGEDAIRGGGVAIGERAPEPAAVAPAEQQHALDEQAARDADEPAPEPDARRKAAGGKIAPGASGSAGAAPSKPVPNAPTTSGGASKGKEAPLPGAKPKPSPKDEPEPSQKQDAGDESWSELARADADRRGGNCGLAKMRYDKLRKVDDEGVRARALAGAGLCAAASDDMATAKKLFAQARAADPAVSDFIDRELAGLEDARANVAEQSPKTAD